MSGSLRLLTQGTTSRKKQIARELRIAAAPASNVRADTLAARAAASNAWALEISAWEPYAKDTLRGYFSVTFPSGLVLHRLLLHESCGHRWVTFPAREMPDGKGKKQFKKLVDFKTLTASQRFQRSAIKALNGHFEKLGPADGCAPEKKKGRTT